MRDIQNLFLRPLEIDDLQNVAFLHQKAFKESALTKLGLEPVRRYYEWQLKGPHDVYAIGVFDDNKSLLGFCFAGVFRGSQAGFLAKNKKYLILRIITHPWLLLNTMIFDRIKSIFWVFNKNRITTATNISAVTKKPFGILSIAVDPEKQGIGIGSIIMKTVEGEALKKCFSQLILTVHPSNTKAIDFYEHCGWKKIFQDNGTWDGQMIKILST